MTRATAATCPVRTAVPASGQLPLAGSVLAVTARPGQESAELGGLVYAFRRTGARVSLLCLTRGEASPLNATRCARLAAVRPWELHMAASVLGISPITVASYPDGTLHRQPVTELTSRIRHAIRGHRADLLLVIAPEAGDIGDTAVASAARAAACQAGIPAVAATTPGTPGSWLIDLAGEAATARVIQKAAAAAHESQSPALPGLTGRLDLRDHFEPLRWLAFPQRGPAEPGHVSKAGGVPSDRDMDTTATADNGLAGFHGG
jgi:N-acetylglucosamine malate deacetylase 2